MLFACTLPLPCPRGYQKIPLGPGDSQKLPPGPQKVFRIAIAKTLGKCRFSAGQAMASSWCEPVVYLQNPTVRTAEVVLANAATVAEWPELQAQNFTSKMVMKNYPWGLGGYEKLLLGPWGLLKITPGAPNLIKPRFFASRSQKTYKNLKFSHRDRKKLNFF